MTALSFKMPYQTTVDLVISPEEILKLYLHGVPLCDKSGAEPTSDFYRQKILAAQEYIENLLYIKLTEQIIHESQDFIRAEWRTWGYVGTTFPVKQPLQLDGFYNKTQQIGYPIEWLISKIDDSSLSGTDESVFHRQVHLVPSGASTTPSSGGVTFNGLSPHLIYLGLDYIPSFWRVSYVTGFNKVPRGLIDVIGKLAAIQVLIQLGDTYMGVGTNSYSVGLDGLSQSISLLKSNEHGIYGSRINGYLMDLYGKDGNGGIIAGLKAKYRGITMGVC